MVAYHSIMQVKVLGILDMIHVHLMAILNFVHFVKFTMQCGFFNFTNIVFFWGGGGRGGGRFSKYAHVNC